MTSTSFDHVLPRNSLTSADHDYEPAMNKFLALYKEPPVRTLAELVQFNKDHASVALPPPFPGQQLLESALTSTLPPAKYAQGIKTIRQAARTNGIDKTLSTHNLDVIIGPMDGRIPTIAAAAGCPVGTMPMGYSMTNGRAFGACVVAAAHGEAKILRAMSAWHATMPGRKAPPQLVQYYAEDMEHGLPPRTAEGDGGESLRKGASRCGSVFCVRVPGWLRFKIKKWGRT